ncbi:hypothetical protein Dimus_038520 [Dionaea muscipula]
MSPTTSSAANVHFQPCYISQANIAKPMKIYGENIWYDYTDSITCLSSVHKNRGYVLSRPPRILPCAAPTMSSSDNLKELASSSKYAPPAPSSSEILPRSASSLPSSIYARRFWSIPWTLSDQ